MADYTGPVIDAHHSIWLRKDVAWLTAPPKPHLYGDTFGLRKEDWICPLHRDLGSFLRYETQDDAGKQSEVLQRARVSLNDFFNADPKLRELTAKAPGYAVFTTFGISFLMPVLLLLLNRAGIVTSGVSAATPAAAKIPRRYIRRL
jgi:hypothetical protein